MWPDSVPLFPERASALAREIDALYFSALAVTAFFSLLIAGLIFYLMMRYRRRHADEVGDSQQATGWLEIAWTIIPLVILLAMFSWGAKIYFEVERVPADAVEFFVVGKQWMWKIQHPQGNREINELHVPVGQAVKLSMTSEDVIHSFFVPELRIKKDVIPGRYTTLWFRADRVGQYRLFCTEYCGAEHSLMIGRLVVMEPNDYETWLAGGAPGTNVVTSGEQLFVDKACNTCHRRGSDLQAPLLEGLYGRQVLLAGGDAVIADRAYLRESILTPGAKVVAGYEVKMPVYQGQMSEEELLTLLAFIESLAEEG
jgi:cytochrome c oxidase subunit 2